VRPWIYFHDGDTRPKPTCRPERSRRSVDPTRVTRNVVDVHRSCELPKLVDRIVREIEPHRSLDRLGLRHPWKARHERGEEDVVELEGGSHDDTMP